MEFYSQRYLCSNEKRPEKFGREPRHLNPDLCDAGAVLHQLSYRANRNLVVMWVDYKPYMMSIDMYLLYKQSKIPSELSRENFISSHVKITCYLHT